MSRRLRASPLARALQRAATSMTRTAFKAGAKAAGKAVARTVDAVAAQYRPPPGSGDWIAGQAMGPAGVRRFFLFRPLGVRNDERLPLVVMETPYRLTSLLEDISKTFGRKQWVTVAYNLTLPTEHVFRGEVEDVLRQTNGRKGEFVLIVHAS